MAEYDIAVAMVRQCCLDPDRVYSKRLSGRDRFGLAFAREFTRGTVETIGLQRGCIVVVITAYWLVPDRATSIAFAWPHPQFSFLQKQ